MKLTFEEKEKVAKCNFDSNDISDGAVEAIEQIIDTHVSEAVKSERERITELENALIDMWEQFAYRGHNKDNEEIIYTGGLSALENCEDVLKKSKLIDDNGLPSMVDGKAVDK